MSAAGRPGPAGEPGSQPELAAEPSGGVTGGSGSGDLSDADHAAAPSVYGVRFPSLASAAEEPPGGQHGPGGAVVRVAEAALEDIGRGVVRLDPYLLSRLGAQPGMAVTVTGERRTVAIAQPAAPHLYGQRQICMDGMVRENARASLGEYVTVAPVEAAPAKAVLVAPLDGSTYGPHEVAQLRDALSGLALVYGDRVKVTAFAKRGHLFKVAGTEPDGAVVVGPFTDVRIKRDAAAGVIPQPASTVKYEDVGGLEEELLRVRELVELPLRYPAVFARLKIEPPKGVLLYGPPGSGKTLIARAVAGEVKAHFIHVNGPEIIHKFYGESEAKLREIFDEAQRRAPTVIFLDELDAIAPRRLDVSGDVEKRVVAQLLASMDGLVSRGEVVVIAATNLPEAIDPALRRPGRFDREIAVSVPSRAGRLRILQIHSHGMPLASDVDLEWLAEVTHGFVGADLEALCKEAGMLAARDRLADLDATLAADAQTLAAGTVVRGEHFHDALKAVEPTATREFFLEKPNVHWDDLGGLDAAKETLVAALDLPRRYPTLFRVAGVRPPTGFLLVGPPGTGKTLAAKALATETGLRLITVDPASLFSRWVGESEKALRQVFKKAKQAAPCILFFDGLDAMVPAQGAYPELEGGLGTRLIRQFYAELDALTELSEVVVLGATSRPDRVDPAALRPGRFGFTVEFQLPDAAQCAQIAAVHLRRVPLGPDVDLTRLGHELNGMSGAEIAGVCQRAVLDEIQRFTRRHGARAETLAGQGGFRLSAASLHAAARRMAAADLTTTPVESG